jgi:exonuclease III
MLDNDVIALGRPKGGLAILWKNMYNPMIRFIGSSLNGRVMAVMFKCKSINVCLFNVYLPCFEYNDEYSIELMECVGFIDLVIDQQKDVNGLEICIIGDYNVDIKRIFNNNKASVLQNILCDYQMNVITKKLEDKGAYTFHNDALKIFSMIDHCAVTAVLDKRVKDVNIIDHIDDWSDHKPIEVIIN